MTPSPDFARAFNLIHPDRTLHGVQFPSGRVVVDDPQQGLAWAAIDLDHLDDQEGRIVWQDETGAAP